MHVRRQATLYVPTAEALAIETVRARFNPAQFGLIRAHVTLCREDEVHDWSALASRLRTQRPFAITLEFGPPTREGDAAFLRTVGPTTPFDALRSALLATSATPPRRLEPHITLVHPRNGVCSDADFVAIRASVAPCSVVFDAVTLIEQRDGGPWVDLETFR